MKRLVSLLLVAACGLVSLPASAGQITIDFEHTPGADGKLGTADDVPMPDTFLQPLRDQFASLGLTFTQGSLLQASFFDGNASNHFISSTLPIALLSTPLSSIGIESYSYWNATLTAYGIDGQAVASSRLLNPDNGSAFYRGELSVTSAQPIYGFAVTADNPNYILNLDNLVLTSADATTTVPEPADATLFALGLSLVTLSLRARGRKR